MSELYKRAKIRARQRLRHARTFRSKRNNRNVPKQRVRNPANFWK